jgi:hypothetical protein
MKKGAGLVLVVLVAMAVLRAAMAHGAEKPKPSLIPDIFDLMAQGKVEVTPYGAGIQRVDMIIRRTVAEPLTVRIPVGTYLVPRGAAYQGMVTTAERVVTLGTGEPVRVSLDAACTNRVKQIPGYGDGFVAQRSPNLADLRKLAPALERAGVSYPVRQAAVWIVTDNATYGDMGILVRRYGGATVGRVITASDAAQAMRICSEAGIDITRKAIWFDRGRLRAEVPDDTLRQWLDQR